MFVLNLRSSIYFFDIAHGLNEGVRSRMYSYVTGSDTGIF